MNAAIPGFAAHDVALQDLRAAARRSPAETKAEVDARAALAAVTKAITSFQEAEFGSHVTQPLRDALDLVSFSLEEVRS